MGTVLTAELAQGEVLSLVFALPSTTRPLAYAPSCVIERASCTDWNSWDSPRNSRPRSRLSASVWRGWIEFGLVESGRNLATGYLPAVTSVICLGVTPGAPRLSRQPCFGP